LQQYDDDVMQQQQSCTNRHHHDNDDNSNNAAADCRRSSLFVDASEPSSPHKFLPHTAATDNTIFGSDSAMSSSFSTSMSI
jgi:hypothetical protein